MIYIVTKFSVVKGGKSDNKVLIIICVVVGAILTVILITVILWPFIDAEKVQV